MSIYWRPSAAGAYSAEDPEKVYYNGAELGAVYWNGVNVWTRSTGGYIPNPDLQADRADYEPDLSGRVITVANGDYKAWMRDLTSDPSYAYESDCIYFDWDGSLFFKYGYEGQCTVQVPYIYQTYIGMGDQFAAGTMEVIGTRDLSSDDVSGLPANAYWISMDVTSPLTVTLECYKVTGITVPETPTYRAVCKADLTVDAKKILLKADLSGHNGHLIKLAAASWSYQGGCKVEVYGYTGGSL